MVYWILIYNLARTLWLKLRYGNRYQAAWVERLHRSVDIRLYGRSRIKIGRNVEIAKNGELWCFGDAKLKIGDGCYMNNRLMVSCHCGVTIGEGCLFGPDVKIFDNNHRFAATYGVSPMLSAASVTIGSHCWIASNVVILKGTKIGDNCVIGAGCVISGEIPAGSLVKQRHDNFVIEKIK